MSNWYDKTLTEIGKGNIDLSTLTDPRLIAINDAGLYTFSQAHDFLDDVAAGARLATQALSSVTFGVSGEGWLDSADPTFITPAVDIVTAFIIYDHTGVESTSRLLLYIDQGLNLPITTESGRDLEVLFSANGIAKL